MSKVKKVRRHILVDANNFANPETGETLSSELNDKVSIKAEEETDLITISSDEYIVFDSKAMIFICSILSKPDVEKVFRMSNMVKTDCSILYQNNNTPHDTKSLSISLNFSQDELRRLIKRLVSANILAYTVCAPTGFTRKIYMLNPFLARKRKTIHCELQEIFSDLSDDKVQMRIKENLNN